MVNWKLKIQAFLHDPPEKALVWGPRYGHKKAAEELRKIVLGDETLPPQVDETDRISSALDRIVFDEEKEVRFWEKPEITNILSGKEYKIPQGLRDLHPKIIRKHTDKILRRVLGEVPKSDDSLCFLTLWRLFPKKLEEDINEEIKLGFLWHLLPADTRIPDHSIWAHLSTTSALVTSFPKPAFLLFSFGPVQKFISTARRTRDLWIGSYILSYLTWKAMEKIVEQYGPDVIIYPNLYAQPLVDFWLSQKLSKELKPDPEKLSIANLPNCFLAILPFEEAKGEAESAARNLNQAWEEICLQVKKKVEKETEKDEEWEKLWERQIRDFFQVYWVILPWMEKANPSQSKSAKEVYETYKELVGEKREFEERLEKFIIKRESYVNVGTAYELLYDLCSRGIEARKNLRDFKQKEEKGYKCTLCGEREALYSRIDLREGESLEAKIKGFWKEMGEKFEREFREEGKERLCAICLTKRLAFSFFKEKFKLEEELEHYPSTSSIAVAPFQEKVLEKAKELKGEVEEFVNAIRNLDLKDVFHAFSVPKVKKSTPKGIFEDFIRLDGSWFFEDFYEPQRIKEECGQEVSPDPGKVNEAKKRLKKLLDKAKSFQIPAPSRYFAVIHMDGDEMGKWLGGEKGPKLGEIVHEDMKAGIKDLAGLQRPLCVAHHGALSLALKDFSTKIVRLVVEELHCGKLIYAGGDDLLALSPKEKALEIARKLRILFSGKESKDGKINSNNGIIEVEEKGKKEYFQTMGDRASMSAGIAIVHHTYPLSQTISKAIEMERKAKEEEGRDAFWVASIKRSGEEDRFGYKWILNGEDIICLIGELKNHFVSSKLSPRFIYNLAEELKMLDPGKANKEIIRMELRRLIKRHIPSGRGEKDFIDILTERLSILFNVESEDVLDKFLKFLKFSAFLAREERE